LDLIANRYGKPLVATSANLSGSPIIFEDDQALEWLGSIADHILVYDRKIVAPQDDSVLQFTERGQKIILRRSRGLAPNYFPLPSIKFSDAVLAMGAELKSAYAIAHHDLLFVSQFLGDQQSVESQKSFQTSLDHVCQLLECSPETILVDQHPGYFVSQEGKRIAKKRSIPVTSIQHHEAHFASVMAENDLFETNRPVLGIICDGAGYGHDGQIWGGEIFVYDEGMIKRAAHLEYFPQFLGDKMNKEPRLSALSLLRNFSKTQQLLQKHFTDKEWDYYTRLLSQPQKLMTSSMGRLIDAVACLLGMPPVSGYEGEAAMQLEALAKTCTYRTYDYYHLPLHNGVLDWKPLLHELIEDWNQKEPNEMIAWKFFYSIARAIAKLSDHYYIDQVAFSGGVFQNALLVDMLIELMQKKRQLFFHKQVSPNDECIGLGQLAWYSRFGKIGQEKFQEQKEYSNSQLSIN
jgi:hydrogenase maturation protein HypF